MISIAVVVLLPSTAALLANVHGIRPSGTTCRRSTAVRMDDEDGDRADLNYLQTRLGMALEREDYAEAAKMRDQIRRTAGVTGDAAWKSLGIPDWLSDRLERLDFPLPTRVQVHSLRALELGDDAAVCAPTGSGKTLSYLLPVLAQLSGARLLLSVVATLVFSPRSMRAVLRRVRMAVQTTCCRRTWPTTSLPSSTAVGQRASRARERSVGAQQLPTPRRGMRAPSQAPLCRRLLC